MGLEDFLKTAVAQKSYGSVQISVGISTELRDRLQACAGICRTSESALARAMIEAGVDEVEGFIEREGVKAPSKGKKP